jgi:ribosomal subunit interface protein
MNIEMTSGKDVDINEMLRDRVELKLTKVESRLGQKLFFRVRFDKEAADQYTCQVHFNSSRSEFNASATEDDLIKSADQAISKIERQLKKFQSKQSTKGRMSIRDTTDIEVDLGDDVEL